MNIFGDFSLFIEKNRLKLKGKLFLVLPRINFKN